MTPNPHDYRRPRHDTGEKSGLAGAAHFTCKDKGVFPDLDGRLRVDLPPEIDAKATKILVDKEHRTLSLMVEGVPIMSWPIALGFEPKGTKIRQGDGKTPEGKLRIVEIRSGPKLPGKYGAASLLLSYPRVEDAERGRSHGIVGPKVVAAVRQAERAGKIPPQRTPLGSSIRIHGGGASSDWTLGCIGMEDEHILTLLDHIRVGTRVTVLRRLPKSYDRDRDGIPDTVDVLVGAHRTVLNHARYEGGFERLAYPGGDVPRDIGVCTDVVIRAMRNAGWDLQVLVDEDMKKKPGRYSHEKPNAHIMQRRVRILIRWFKGHFTDLGADLFAKGQKHWLPGDIVFMDTLPKAGPDHIGILSENVGSNGYPLVVNNWTNGYSTSEMELLPAIPLTHRFRLPTP